MAAFERAIVVALLAMMMVAVTAATIYLGYTLVCELARPPVMLLSGEAVPQLFGLALMVLIGLELLETMKTYLSKARFQVEVVFLVAMIAMARKVILLDVKVPDAGTLAGVAALILALGVGFYLLKRATRKDASHPSNASPPPHDAP
ncbi:MAG: phosphate-starvation-inducible E-like protein [Planctomycetes bacterium]|nr:phosphate-starvation-inducible E-like protein [Planctomycetota bacterium]